MNEHTPSVIGLFKRSVSNVESFFFKPGDPTTLGLMRVVAGILAVYVHLAYTGDLVNFFGKNAWVNLELANELRSGVPFITPPSDFEDKVSNIMLPGDESLRVAFIDWMRALPTDPRQRRDALTYLYDHVPPNRELAMASLAFAQNLVIQPRNEVVQGVDFDGYVLTPASMRKQHFDWLENPQSAPRGGEVIPKHFREMPDVGRVQTRRKLEAFLTTLPKEPGRISRLFGHLTTQALTPLPQRTHADPNTDLQRTLKYIEDDLPNEPGERDTALAYLKRWSVDPKRTYAQGTDTFSIWFHVTDPTAMYVVHVCILAVMIMFAVGLFTRITSVLTWLGAVCYIHRSNQVLFGLDTMMNLALIYLMIGPSGATLSIDRWLAKRRVRKQLAEAKVKGGDTRAMEAFLAAPTPSVAANLATRLLQINFCYIYAASGFSKLKGGSWWSHQAIWMTIANPEFSPTVFAPYRWFLRELCDHRWLWELFMSFGAVFTLGLEIAFPFLVWRPRLRPYMVVAGVMLHTGIATMMGLTVFSLYMMVLLMSFIPPEVVRYWLDRGGALFTLADFKSLPPPVKRPVAVG